MNIVSYGGGTNSVAMLVGMRQREEKPDAIIFADTRGEKPFTYLHLWLMSEWCLENDFPPIFIVHGQQPQQIKDGSLENECLRLGCLPSKAYGFSSCSQKWKIAPQEQEYKRLSQKLNIPLSDFTVSIGFDAEEIQRITRAKNTSHLRKTQIRFPLEEWNWGREECIANIKKAGIPLPQKSSCFFCPSSKLHEIKNLQLRYPDLLTRALEIERRALAGEGPSEAYRGIGLGRYFKWSDILRQGELFPNQFTATIETDCGCYDGE